MKLLIIWLMLAVMVAVAHGKTYQWLDDRGVTHFTDDPDKIPGKYLKRVKERDSVKGEEIRVTPQEDAPPAAVPGGSSDVRQNLYGGHEEAWWRGRFAAVRNEIKRIQDALPAKNDELDKLHRKWVISKGRKPREGETGEDRFIRPPAGEGDLSHALGNPGRHRSAYYEKKSEIEKNEARIKELQESLNNLEVEAGNAGVPLEWR
jgi:uncharacterized protein DUF4124